jgi:hypothetical protein
MAKIGLSSFFKQKPPKFKAKLTDTRNPNELVNLYANNNGTAKKCIVHKEFACHYPPVLNAVFNGHFLEGQTQEYHLDTTESTAEFLVQYLYSQQLEVHQLESKVYNKEESQGLINAWILGDELLMPGFQNGCLRKIREVETCLRKSIGFNLRDVRERTGEGSQLRRYVVESAVRYVT